VGSIPSVSASVGARKYIRQWINEQAAGRKVVTITLRECDYELSRNSDLPAWAEFACSLDKTEYIPVVVRDISRALGPVPDELKDHCIFSEIPWNIELRMALYEMSYLNLLVNQGPGILCYLGHSTKYLIFMWFAAGGAADEAHFRRTGVVPGQAQLAMASPFQRLVWERDSYDTICREFAEIDGDIRAAARVSLGFDEQPTGWSRLASDRRNDGRKTD